MLKKAGCCMLLLGVLSALNVQWAVLQGIAWANMLNKEVRQLEDFKEAINRTFGGEYPCDICGLVESQLKKNPYQESASLAEFLTIKLLPVEFKSVTLPERHIRDAQRHSLAQTALRLNHTPETPPPRLV